MTNTSKQDTGQQDRGRQDTGADAALGYAAALDELDTILRELEGSDVDVDHLAERVARASKLIALCRERITNAQVEIERVTTELDT
jgi:exodeoxyribonuclease VII small subunit